MERGKIRLSMDVQSSDSPQDIGRHRFMTQSAALGAVAGAIGLGIDPATSSMYDAVADVGIKDGTAASHEAARATVLDGITDGFDAPGSGPSVRRGHGWSHGVLDVEGCDQLLEMLDEGLRQGALGNVSTLGHWLAVLTREMFEVQRLAAKYLGSTGLVLEAGLPAGLEAA